MEWTGLQQCCDDLHLPFTLFDFKPCKINVMFADEDTAFCALPGYLGDSGKRVVSDKQSTSTIIFTLEHAQLVTLEASTHSVCSKLGWWVCVILSNRDSNTVACLLKARTVKPAEAALQTCLLLGNGSVAIM